MRGPAEAPFFLDLVRQLEANLKRKREERSETACSEETKEGKSQTEALPSGRSLPPTPPAPKQRRADRAHSD